MQQITNQTMATWSGHLAKVIGLWLVIMLVISVTHVRLDQLVSFKNSLPTGTQSIDDRMRQLECLTRNIYWEAASEPFEGKVAVAQVTINRTESGRWPNTVCGVVYQKNIIYEKVVCQFSWFCEGAHKMKPVHTAQWKESEEVAKRVLFEGFRLPSLRSAYYYHADYVNPGWKLNRIDKIGNHIFYGERK
jgi:spore germination cell wall hydrolase CwlJ-like protein